MVVQSRILPPQALARTLLQCANASRRCGKMVESPRTRMKYTKSISEHIHTYISGRDTCDEVGGIEFHRSVYNDDEDVISRNVRGLVSIE